jgi:PAS domain S-box-containing protein
MKIPQTLFNKITLLRLIGAVLLAGLFSLPASAPMLAQEDDNPRPAPVTQIQDPIILTTDHGEYPVGLHLEILEDKDGLLTIENVTSPEISRQFVPSQEETPSFGFTKSAFWTRFQAKDLADEPVRWLLSVDSNLFFIEVYVPVSNPTQYRVTQTGTALPFDAREIEHPRFLFALPLAPDQEATVYVRLESESAMNFPMTILSAEALSQDDLVQQVLNGFIYGVLLIMVGYNLILFLYLRDRSYLYYVFFLSFLLMSFMVDDGFAHQYLWPSQGRLNAIGGQLFFVLAIMAALKFTASFLPTREDTPRLHTAINIVIVIFALVLPILLIDISVAARPNLILTVIAYILVVAAGVIFWRRGYHPARYFLLAWLLLLTSMIIFVLSLFAFFPQSSFAVAGSQIGIVVLTLTLSLALADRISTYRQEKEAAQQAMMRKQEEFAESLRQANLELEEQFEERAQELSFAQEQIDMLFRDSTLAFGTADMDGRVLTANDAMKTMLGYPKEEIFEANVMDFFADGTFRQKIMEELTRDRYIRAPMVQLRRKDGALFYANVTESVLSRKDQDVMLGIVDDITDQVLAEQAQQMEAEQVAVAEERNRIAQDLHDSVTQSLYSTNLFAEAGREIVEVGDVQGASHYFTRIGATSQQALKEMRLFLYELRPPDVVKEGLVDGLQKRLDAVEKRSGMEARLLLDGPIDYPDDVSDQFYRISQEALNNVLKHAQADEVTVYLRANDRLMVLEVVDNGVGFDPAEVGQDGGLGLKIMRERAAQINGDFSVISAPNQGTIVQVKVKKTDE